MLLSKTEDAHVDRFGDRGNTKAHEADPISAGHVQKKLEDSLKSSFRVIKFLWLLKKVTDKLQSCFYQLYPAPPLCSLVPLSGHKADSLHSGGQSTLRLHGHHALPLKK